MTKIALVVAGAALIVALSFVIDAQSRTPAIHRAATGGPSPIMATGRIEGATQEIELRFYLAGRVQTVCVEEGQEVRQGDVLVELDDQQYQQEVALAEADLQLAEAQLERLKNGPLQQERDEAAALYRAKTAELEQAQRLLGRVEQLRESKAVAQQEVDDQESQVASLAAEVEAAKARLDLIEAPARPDEVRMEEARVQASRARLELAKVQHQRSRLRAPCDGQVLDIEVQVGELTGPDAPVPALVLANTRNFRVRAFVEELDAPRIETGMRAAITVDGLPGRILPGRVARLSPRMGPKELYSDQPAERYDTKTREVWIDLEEAENVLVGLRVDVAIRPDIPAELETSPLHPEADVPQHQQLPSPLAQTGGQTCERSTP